MCLVSALLSVVWLLNYEPRTKTLFPFTLQGPCYSGFLWDTAASVELRDIPGQENSPSNGHGKAEGPSPFLARFKVLGAVISEIQSLPKGKSL